MKIFNSLNLILIDKYHLILLLLKKKFSGILAISLSLAVISTIGVYAETSTIPDWVKNNAKWWSEGQIGETDYISSLQYLINQGIIQIPITEVTAATTSLSDSERAQSFVVRFFGGDFFTETITIYTYSQFFHFRETIASSNISFFTDRPAFLLLSLPSHDKAVIYDLVNRYVNPGKVPDRFDVSVDVLAGDGSIIQTWDYRKCDVIDYSTFVNDKEDEYRFSDSDEAEIRDILVIECAGFSLN